MNVSEVLAPWSAIDDVLGLSGGIRDEAHYQALLTFVDECFEKFGADEHHPIFTLVDLLAAPIREYEARMHPWPDSSTPAQVLAWLMEQHGLRQGDLPEVGSQGVVSEVLAGKRQLNIRQIGALSKRFGLPADVLMVD